MNEEDLLYTMALSMLPDIGAITAKKLIAYVGSPEAVFKEKTSTLMLIPGIGQHLAGKINPDQMLRKAEIEMISMRRNNISSLYFEEAEYPWKLKNCDDGPILLFYKGKNDFNRTKHLSIVGTRNATTYGREVCKEIIASLSAKHPDLIIVSGLAYGVDITAHRATLEYGLDTFAVLAHGLNTIYPHLHRETAFKITRQGALVSDFHSTIKPERNNFLRRNRIIAGLSDATLVIESGRRGGSLITAEMASSYSREVFALPGRTEDNYSVGCNNLIKRNVAALIESADDIELLLNWEVAEPAKPAHVQLNIALSDQESTVLEIIRDSPLAGPEIIGIRANIALPQLMALLLQMELRNWITVQPGNTYRLSVKLPE
jgi:DNA processing protein